MPPNLLYGKLARFYDRLNGEVDYKKEADFILKLMDKKEIKGDSLLDMGCGTGNHILYLKDKFKDIYGLEASEDMLRIARKKIT